MQPRRANRATVPRLMLVVTVVSLAMAGMTAPAPAASHPRPTVVHADLGGVVAERMAGAVTRTAAVDVGAPFAMVGLSHPVGWPGVAEIRTATADAGWSAWTPLPTQEDEGPDPGSPEAPPAGRTATPPLYTGPADRLEVRVRGADPADLGAILVDPFGLSRSSVGRVLDRVAGAWAGRAPAPAAAAAATPPIVTRAEWGADESIVTGTASYAREVDRVFVHHTVGRNDYTAAEAPAVVRGVQAYHIQGNGWRDLGYNFLIDRFGTIYEGRAGGIERAVIGAQAGGFNTGSTGVALMGTYAAPPSAATTDALTGLIAWLADLHHFSPLGSSAATSAGSTRFPEGTVVTLPNVSGHRDVSATECPGEGTYGLLAQLRTGSRERIGDMVVDDAVDVSQTRVIRGDPDAAAATITATLDPPGPWTVEARDPAGTVLLREDGEGERASAALAFNGVGWSLGEHTLTVSSPGRRSATRVVRLVPPVIADPATSVPTGLAGIDGRFASPVGFSATLWPGASWHLEVRSPDGTLVHEESGQSEVLSAAWAAVAGPPGTYAWRMAAEDASPVSGVLEVRYDVLDRVADVEDPVAAGVALSARAFPSGTARRAVVARADVFADALAGGPLAGADGPLLLTASDALDPRVAAELDRVLEPGSTIWVLGGPAAISDAVADALSAHGIVRRAWGPSRVATAAAIAEVVVARSGQTVAMVARAGPDDVAPWADALAGGAYGAREGIPVLLTATSRLSGETADALDALNISSTIVLGGTAAISDAVLDDLPAPVRLAGEDRAATAAAVADRLWGSGGPVHEVLLANGSAPHAWAWALTAAPLAARRGSPLLLTGADALARPSADLIARMDVRGGAVLGPASLVADEVAWSAGALAAGR